MNKNSFTHKILPILAIFMFVLFTLTTSCFAVDYNYDIPSIPVNNNYSDYFVYKGPERCYVYYYNSSYAKPYYYLKDNGECYVFFIDSNSTFVSAKTHCSYIDIGGTEFSRFYDNTGLSYIGNSVPYYIVDSSEPVYLADVSFDTNGGVINSSVAPTDNLVFPEPVEEVAKQTILAPVMMETTQEGTTLQEIIQTKTLQEVLEILPIVIPVMVGLIACLIGLRYLWRLLRKA